MTCTFAAAGPFGTLLGVVGHLCAFGSDLNPSAGDRGLVDEQVLAPSSGVMNP